MVGGWRGTVSPNQYQRLITIKLRVHALVGHSEFGEPPFGQVKMRKCLGNESRRGISCGL